MTDAAVPPHFWSMTEVARVLLSSNALASIKTPEAIVLAQRMRISSIDAGRVLFRAGATNTEIMALVLEGEAVVENFDAGAGDGIVLNVLQAGDVIGEMGIISNTPRSATVTASCRMMVATLDQKAFAQLIRQRPDVACGFLSSILQSVSDRLRESNRKLQTLTKINQSMFEELEVSRYRESHLGALDAPSSSAGDLTPEFHPTQAK